MHARFLVCATALVALRAAAGDVAQTPPMGWDSYDCFSYAVTEQQVRENTDFMAQHLKSSGWQYVIVDYVWSCPLVGPGFAPQQDANFNPRLNMDEFGRLQPDTNRFPSSAEGKGFKPLADYVHSQGLKFGIHLMRGIPRQAVAANTPVLALGAKSTNMIHAADVANRASVCSWLNHMYGLRMSDPGAQAYLDSLLIQYAAWGVDYIKVDDLSRPYSAPEIEGYRKAIEHSGREMVFSTSPGATPLEEAAHVKQFANMWRVEDDLWDRWPLLNLEFDHAHNWYPGAGPGHWPDLDMLPLGRLRKYGPPTGRANSNSSFNSNEVQTMMTLWCITRAPLIFGGNLPETDPFTLSFLTNREALDVNQHSTDNHPVIHGAFPIWTASSLHKASDRYLAVFNRHPRETNTINVRLSDLGIRRAAIRNLWAGENLGEFTNSFEPSIPPRGAGLYCVTLLGAAPVTIPLVVVPQPAGDSYEAESTNNSLGGRTAIFRDQADGHASGGAFVGSIGNRPPNTLRFQKVRAGVAGTYLMTVCYMADADLKAYVKVNDQEPQTYNFPWTGGLTGFYVGTKEIFLELDAGDNNIEFGNPSATAPNIDRITIRPAK